MASEFQGQFQEAMREAELVELKKQAEDLKSSVSDLGNLEPLADTQKQSRARSRRSQTRTAKADSSGAAGDS